MSPRAHSGRVRCLVASVDGLFSAGADGFLRAWSLPALAPLCSLQADVSALSCAPDGTLYGGGADGVLRAWRSSDLVQERASQPVRSAVVATALSHDVVASAHADGCVRLWSTAGLESTAFFSPSSCVTGALVLLRDATLLLCGGADGSLRAFSTTADAHGRHRCLSVVGAHAHAVTALRLLPGGGRLASASSDGELRVWRVSWSPLLDLQTELLAAWAPHPGSGLLALVAVGEVLFTCGEAGCVRSFQATGGALSGPGALLQPRTADWLTCLCAIGEAMLAAGGADGQITLFNLAQLQRSPAAPQSWSHTSALAALDSDPFPELLREERAVAERARALASSALRARQEAQERARQEALRQAGTAAGWRGGHGLDPQSREMASVYGIDAVLQHQAIAQAQAAALARRPDDHQ